MNITLTPEEVKVFYAYIYGGSDAPEEYRLGEKIYDKVFGMVEKEIDTRIVKALDNVLEASK